METLTQNLDNIKVRKVNNNIENFDIDKLVSSCINCGVSPNVALKITKDVAEEIKDREDVTTSDIRNSVYNKLFKISPKIATEYHYRSDLRVRTSATIIANFDRQKIVNSLITETKVDASFAQDIAREVEKELARMHLNYVTAPLIREIVNVKLLEHHQEGVRARYTRLGMPVYDAMKLINSGSKENANLQHNPETIHKLMADSIAREYALVNVIPTNLADSHMKGEIHIHDLDYFATRPFCFSHDIRFFLKNGFKADGSGMHSSVAGPAKRPEVAFLHAAKVLSSAQTNCAGGQGFSYFNTFLAPYIEGMDYKQVKQLAQMFIYEMGQMYVARGGQVVFSSVDLDMGLPKLFEDVPAVTIGGKIKGTYADYAEEIKTLFNALTDVYLEGDHNKRPFNFPKFEVQIYPKEMKKDEEELLKVSELSAKFGTPYYIINQPYMPDFACYQSLPYDEKILLVKNGNLLPVKIGEYVEEVMKNSEVKIGRGIEGEVEVSNCNCSDCAVSINTGTLCVEKKKIGKVMKHKTTEKIFKLTLDGNREVSATQKHKIPVVRDNKITEIRVEGIKEGDFIIGLKNLNLNFNFDDSFVYKNKNLDIDEDISRLLGYFAAEGYIHIANPKNRANKVCFSFNSAETNYINDVSSILKNKFAVGPKYDISEKNKTTTVYVYDKELTNLFAKHFETGKTARSKRVPKVIFSAPSKLVKEFLLGMFKGDGYSGDGCIDLHLCNKELIDDLFILLLRLGIPFEFLNNGTGNFDSYSLRLTSNKRVQEFLNLVPFAETKGDVPEKTFDFYDRIPVEPFNITRENMITGHWNRSQIGKRVTRDRLAKGDNLYSKFFGSDLHLFEVKKIEEVKSEYVYDLIDVEDNHNFANNHGIFSSNCCSFLMPLDDANSEEDIINGTVRGGGLQVVTINLPQIAYEARGNDEKLYEILRDRMEKARDVLLLKNKIINKNLKHKMLPFMGQPIDDKGTLYLNVDKQSYIIGIIGMNEMLKSHTGEEIHESANAWTFGLKVMKKMKDIVAEFRKETKLNFALARTPAESTATRLALIDRKNYGDAAVFQGELPGAIYYTNSFQLRPSADVPLFEKLKIEGSFHPLTDGGALTQVWLGEHHPDPEALLSLTKKIATKTAIQYFPYTRDLSVCNVCGATVGGLHERCKNCGAENLQWVKKEC